VKLLGINHHEEHLQPTKLGLFWGYFDYAWFTKGNYDFLISIDGYLGLEND
jgi:hypothetical protein